MTQTLQKTLILAALATSLSGLGAQASAITLNPENLNVTLAETVFVDINVSGLGAFAPVSLGAFDLDFLYDDSALSFVGATFTTLLGDELFFESLTSVTPSAGMVELSQVSFLTPGDLDALQPASFTLATVELQSLINGPTSVSVDNVDLSDGFGNTIVPEPGSVLLLGTGLLGLALLGRRRSRRVERPITR